MTFIIHRGANEIGGSCVEVCTEKTRIILDIGMPLMNKDGSTFNSSEIKDLSVDEMIKEKILPDIPALYKKTRDKETAIIISHSHQDHYGLIDFVDNDIPVYLGKASHKLIELTAVFGGRKPVIKNPIYITSYEMFTFGDVEITPYFMDHACCDAYAFLLCGGGKTLFYSGDFRGHGRKLKSFYKFLHIAPKNVDYMLMEGTSISRSNKRFETEEQLEEQFIKTFNDTKGINFVYVSGQNIDRLVTIFRACRRCGKLFVIDFYIANVLFELSELGYGVPYPSANFPEVKVFNPNLLTKRIQHFNRNDLIDRFAQFNIDYEEINQQKENIVMTIRSSMAHEIKQIKKLKGSTLIYSMWEGYKDSSSTKRFLNNIVKNGVTINTIHTSGHADNYTLKKMYNAVLPKMLIPIHTVDADKYQELFNEVVVNQVIDGETIGNESNDVSLLAALEEIGKAYEKSGILPKSENDKIMDTVQQYLNIVCEKLKINEVQAVLFGNMINIFDGYEIALKSVADFIGCKPIKLINYIDELKNLDDKKLIKIINYTEPEEWQNVMTFHIDINTLTALKDNKTPDTKKGDKNIIRFPKK
jgi:ribonuclease J